MRSILAALAVALVAAALCDSALAQERGGGFGGRGGGGGGGGGGAFGGRGGGGGGGGRGGGGQPPAPAPRNEAGRVLLGGATPADKGVWVPVFGITEPIHPRDETPYQPWALALYDARQAHELEPHARCKASGVARQFLTPYGVEFVEVPEVERLFIFDIGGPHTFRTVFMDGRSHPSDLSHTYYGHSFGWWDDDTLVIDSTGFTEGFWYDRRGMPHTEQLHTVERFTRENATAIRYEVTIDDPGAYTAPFTATFNLRWDGGQELFEYVCQQANYAHELMVGGERSTVDRSSAIVP
jgi:hypothetical protein